MRRSSALLGLFLGLLAARGLAAEALDSWRAWVVFKQFVRVAEDGPDPGVSVQIHRMRGSSEAKLFMLRQVVAVVDDSWEPVGGVVCELSFDDVPRSVKELEVWTFDHGTFEHFVDAVEQDPTFAQLIGRRPVHSAVYWDDA